METKTMDIKRGPGSYVKGTFKVYTKEEWMEKGRELFGKNLFKWKFVCPSCGNIQSPEEFRKFKEQGATPADAYFNCIGRFIDITKDAFSDNKPCNYTMGGLISLADTLVIDEKGNEHMVFEFAEEALKECQISTSKVPKKLEFVQLFNPRSQRWVKVSTITGEVFPKKTKGKWKGIPESSESDQPILHSKEGEGI